MGAQPSSARSPELLTAEVNLLEAQAEATRKRGDAEAAAKRAEAAAKRAEADATHLRTYVPLALGLSCASLLALDFYLHESRGHIRRRVVATLRSSTTRPSLPPQPPLLPVPQPRLALGFLPTMLLGPTGCGKSTLLAQLYRESAASTPTTFLRMRMPSSKAALQPSSAEEPHRLLDSLAREAFAQLGFPTRRAVIYTVSERVRSNKFQLSSPAGIRLCDALECLFQAMEELYYERVASGLTPDQAAPVLLLDEVQDLIKSSRLADVGGREVFDRVAQLLVAYCVDRRVVRAAVAGSSALLSVEFDRTVASGSRWRHYELRDPEEGAVLAALAAHGYSESDAHKLVSMCGTRLRLLEPALKFGSEVVDVHTLVSSHFEMATRHFADLFSDVTPVEKAVLCRVLDAAEHAAAEAEMGRGVPLEIRPELGGDVSTALALAASKVLYLHLGGSLSFQSDLHRAVWQAVRAKYVQPQTISRHQLQL